MGTTTFCSALLHVKPSVPEIMIKGTAKNEGSPGKRSALWKPCASKCEEVSSAV